jgi:hypothetical protein
MLQLHKLMVSVLPLLFARLRFNLCVLCAQFINPIIGKHEATVRECYVYF